MTRRVLLLVLLLTLASNESTLAQDDGCESGPDSGEQEPEYRPTGLPAMNWTFGFDAGFGTFSFLNSLFTNPRDEPSGDLSDNWLESYIKPSISAVRRLGNGSAIAGTLSAVGERTYGGAPTIVGEDFSSFAPDELSVSWRSGTAFERFDKNALEFTVGRAPYQIGQGFLLYDGAGEGGSRGGYWSNARNAFEFASIARFTPGPHKAEAFYLDKDELPESDTGSRLWGANYELRVTDASTIGVTYMKWYARAVDAPQRDGLNVFNARASVAPIPAHAALTVEMEYAHESNADVVTSHAWSMQGKYEIADVNWTPAVSYRYAVFQGDDPETAVSEAFDPLFPGFSDWGTWWQGEIAGEYFLSNSNLKSHQIRVHAVPNDSVETGIIFYRFLADQPASYGQGVTSNDLAFEVNAYAEWALNHNFTISLVGGFATPGAAVRQATARTANFGLGMLYVAYTF
jgi:hypothetical protein